MPTHHAQPSLQALTDVDAARATLLRERTLQLLPLLQLPPVPGLPPDRAGTRAYLLASHVANEERRLAQEVRTTKRSRSERALVLRTWQNNLARDIRLLPHFVESADGSTMPSLVRRFIAGERASAQHAKPPQATQGFSAEPLSATATRQRLRELAAQGVDISLLKVQLKLTPTQRVESMLALSEFCEDLQRAGSTATP